jgi:hypothetical protein
MSLTLVMPHLLQEWRHEGPIQRRRPSYGTSRAFSGYCRVFIWSCQVHHPQETSRTMSLDQLYADLNYSQGFWLNVVSLSWKLVYIPRDHAYLIRREDHVCSNKESRITKNVIIFVIRSFEPMLSLCEITVSVWDVKTQQACVQD